jgi:hypothetical protein
MELWRRIVARRQASMAPAQSLDDINDGPGSGSLPSFSLDASPTLLWDRILARQLAAQFPEAGLNADQVTAAPFFPLPNQSFAALSHPPLLLQWYDTLGIPATPLVPEDDDDVAFPIPAAPAGNAATSLAFPASGDEHEDAARKRHVRRKQAVDSAFKARRNSRLASKEPANFVTMLSKAKAAKASRFDISGGSPRLQAAARAAGFDDDIPDPIPLPRLKALSAACGVDPDAVDDAVAVLAGSG